MKDIQIKQLARGYSADFSGLKRLMVKYRPHICPFPKILEHIPEGASVLDIGSGTGLLLYLCGSTKKPERIASMDINAELAGKVQAILKREFPDVKVNLYGDLASIEADETYDAVTMIDVMHHVPVDGQLKFLREAASKVAPGGVFVYKDMCDSLFFGTANRIHDLAVSQEWARYLPIESAADTLANLGFTKIEMSVQTMYWYRHETLVMLKNRG